MKKLNKIAALFIVSIFALSGTGIAFAAWFDTVTIEGTVDTGSLCWQFTSATIEDDNQPINFGGDYPTDTPDLTCHPGFVYDEILGDFWKLDKNVAWGSIERKDLDSDGYYETLELILNNVYPCNFNEVSFYIRNCGTIPLKFNNIVISDGTDESYYIDSDTAKPRIFTLDLNDNGVDDFEIWWNDDDFGEQLEPGDRLSEQSLWLHVLQDEDPDFQGGSFTFYISLVAVQWNEYPYDFS